MPAPHDYLYPFGPDDDEPGKTARPLVSLRKAPADPREPPPEVPPIATRPPATPPPIPPLATQPPEEYAADEYTADDWDDEDDWEDDDDDEDEYEEPHSRNILSVAIRGVVVVALALAAFTMILGFKDTAHLRIAPPMQELTGNFAKKLHFYGKWPFVMSYYLLLPDNYDPRYPYPLIMELHGQDYQSHAGRYLARPEYKHAFPAIVVVPFISNATIWRTAPEAELAIGPAGEPLAFDPLDDAVALIFKLAGQYTVDPSRVYIVGHNTGGMGAYAAAAQYPHVFAAAVSTAGGWTQTQADRITIPMLAYHGADDAQIPAALDRAFTEAANAQGANIHYAELPGRGTDIADDVFSNAQTWQWLFSQRKAR